MRYLHIPVMCFLLLVTPVNLAQAGKHVALVIGNADYDTAPLENPVNDARDMSRALGEMGFDVTTLVNVDKDEMKKGIDRFHGKIKNAEARFNFHCK